MTTTTQSSSANSHALRLLFDSLMAYSRGLSAPAAARDADGHETGHAIICMASLLTGMTARKLFETFLIAIRDWILACLSLGGGHFIQRCLSTGAVRHHIWGPRTMWRCELLRMACLFAAVFAAIVFPLTPNPAVESPSPLLNVRRIITSLKCSLTWSFITALTADDHSLVFTTIATAVHGDLTNAAQTLMAWFLAGMLSAW